MRRFAPFFALAAAMVMGSVAFAQVNLTNSPHDLSSASTADIKTAGTDQLCAFCHTPHMANAPTYGPLWNRNYTPPVGMQTYADAASPTFQGGAIALGPQSYACLSCHDGSVALDNLANVPGSGMGAQPAGYTFTDPNTVLVTNQITNGAAAIGTDLSNDHPVGFSFDTSDAADPGIQAVASVPADLVFYGATNQVECATCHNVHDWDGPAGTYTMFLRRPTTASQICRDCHLK